MTTGATETKQTADGILELSGNPARDLARSFNIRVILFLLLHVPLVFVLETFPVLSTAHGLVVLLFGLRSALVAKSSHVYYAVAYIAGAEVLWRMTRAQLPWEYAKYATVIIVAVAIIAEWGRQSSDRRFRSHWPLFLLLALVPAAVVTVLQTNPATARDYLSFNLSSYLAFGLMALYMWARRVDVKIATRILLALIAPILSVASLAVFNTATFATEFLLASNWVTSGNYGPNQVSNVLGLAALASIMVFVLLSHARAVRLFLILLSFVFVAQAMLTFSRGGVYSFLLGLVVFGLHTLQTARARGRFLVVFLIGTALLVFVVFPWLNDYTGGTLALRLAELDTTGRLEASEADLRAFSDNPVIGTGVGLAEDYRTGIIESSLAAHTEYTRLLAEHGLFGVGVLLIIGWMLLKRYVANPPGLGRGFVAAFAVWSLSVMVHSAMRIEVISLVLALALLDWQVAPAVEPAAETTSALMVNDKSPPATVSQALPGN